MNPELRVGDIWQYVSGSHISDYEVFKAEDNLVTFRRADNHHSMTQKMAMDGIRRSSNWRIKVDPIVEIENEETGKEVIEI